MKNIPDAKLMNLSETMNLTMETYNQIVEAESLEILRETLALESGLVKITYFSGYFISLVNLAVFILSCLLCRIQEIRKPSLVFVANLSLCDAVLSLYNSITSKYSLQELLDVEDLSVEVGGSMTESIRDERCKVALSIFTVSMGNSLSALALLTIDRYLTIKYPLHYSTMMNMKKAAWLAGANWFVWLTFGIISYFSIYRRRNHVCTFVFSLDREFQLISLAIFNIILLIVFLAYRKILSEFYAKKSYLEKLKKDLAKPYHSQPNKITFSATKVYVIPLKIESPLSVFTKGPVQIKSIDYKNEKGRILKTLFEESSVKQNKLSQSLSFHLKYIKSSKYVIAILTVFCVFHLPLFVYICIEMIRSYAGYYEDLHSTICGKDTRTLYEWEKDQDVYVADCLRLLISNKDDFNVCSLPEPTIPNSTYLCHLIHQGTYELLAVSRTAILYTIGVYNAAINPLLYALWYSQFRDGVKLLLKKRSTLSMTNDERC